MIKFYCLLSVRFMNELSHIHKINVDVKCTSSDSYLYLCHLDLGNVYDIKSFLDTIASCDASIMESCDYKIEHNVLSILKSVA